MNSLKAIPILIILCLLIITFALPSYPQDPNLVIEEDQPEVATDDASLAIPRETLENPIFRTTSLLLEVLIFILLSAIVYSIMYVLFRNSIERDNPPLDEFIKYNTIFLISALVFAFICFGHLTYRRSVPPENFADFLSGINWVIWAIIIAVVAVVIIASRTLSGKRKTSG